MNTGVPRATGRVVRAEELERHRLLPGLKAPPSVVAVSVSFDPPGVTPAEALVDSAAEVSPCPCNGVLARVTAGSEAAEWLFVLANDGDPLVGRGASWVNGAEV